MKPGEVKTTEAGLRGDKRPDDKPPVPKPRRGQERGPIGFGHVMRLVRHGKNGGAAGAKGEQLPGEVAAELEKIADPAGAKAAKAVRGKRGAEGVGEAGMLRELVHGKRKDEERERRSDEDARPEAGVSRAQSALGIEAAHVAAVSGGEVQDVAAAGAQAQAQQPAPTNLGAMNPQRALTAVLDEARKLEIEEATRELHIELEPEHLGPLLVKISVDKDRRLRTELHVRNAEAATRLRSGQEGLRDRLAGLGFSHAEVTVEQDLDH